MHYTGKLTKNGRQYDSSKGRGPFTFRYGAGEVIKGWDMGMEVQKTFKKKAKKLVDQGLGHGNRGANILIKAFIALVYVVYKATMEL